MKRDDSIYLRHMLDAIARVRSYLSGVDETNFTRNYLVQDGVIRQLEIIGEAARHVSDELRQKWPLVPWADVAATRNKLIHDYFGVDIEKVWLTAKDDLPGLQEQLHRVLGDLTS